MPRPPVTGITRDERIMVRLTGDEYALLRQVASLCPDHTVSSWVREVSLHFAQRLLEDHLAEERA